MRVLVTGSNGLIGSEAAVYFDRLGAEVIGVDNNMRAEFFGRDGDTRWNQERLVSELRTFQHREIDIRDRPAILRLIADEAPDLIDHGAAQRLKTEYVEQHRRGDHICYISDLRKFESHYPGWTVAIPLRAIIGQIIASWDVRGAGLAVAG